MLKLSGFDQMSESRFAEAKFKKMPVATGTSKSPTRVSVVVMPAFAALSEMVSNTVRARPFSGSRRCERAAISSSAGGDVGSGVENVVDRKVVAFKIMRDVEGELYLELRVAERSCAQGGVRFEDHSVCKKARVGSFDFHCSLHGTRRQPNFVRCAPMGPGYGR